MRRLRFSELGGRRRSHHIAATRVQAGERTAEHTHDFPEFFLILEGAAVHVWNGRQYPLAAGDLALVLAADRHHYRCAGTQTLRFVNLALAPGWWRSFDALLDCDALRADPARRLRRLGPRERTACARVLGRLLEGDGSGAAELASAAATLAGALAASSESAALVPEADLAQAPEWLSRLVDRLEDAQAPQQSLAHWQKLSGRSPEHLARSCRKYLGVTLTQLVHRIRLNRAKALLRDGEHKVADAAFEAGFNNLGHFYRTFREAEGCSPLKWARIRRAAATVPR